MGQPTILVAEDERIFTFDLCDTVQEAGFTIAGPYADSSSAIEAFKQVRPDLVILDVDLDGGDVYPLAQQLIDEHVPIIFHSEVPRRAELKKRFPSARTIDKPCPPSVMLSKVNQALTQR